MYDRIEKMLAEKAKLGADREPLAARHFHGACNDLTALLMQARDRLMTHGLPLATPELAPVEIATPSGPLPGDPDYIAPPSFADTGYRVSGAAEIDTTRSDAGERPAAAPFDPGFSYRVPAPVVAKPEKPKPATKEPPPDAPEAATPAEKQKPAAAQRAAPETKAKT